MNRIIKTIRLFSAILVGAAVLFFCRDSAQASEYSMLSDFKGVVLCTSEDKTINIRLAPDINSEIIGVAEYGDMYPVGQGRYVVKGKGDDPHFWYSITCDDGSTGFVCIDYFTRGLKVQEYYLEKYKTYACVDTEEGYAAIYKDAWTDKRCDVVDNDTYLTILGVENGRVAFGYNDGDDWLGYVKISDITVAYALPGPTPEELEAQRLAELAAQEEAEREAAEQARLAEEAREASVRQAIVDTALAQVGNSGGETFWSWYGWEFHVSWCACYVSWVEEQNGMISAGKVPMFDQCQKGRLWFIENGLWAEGGYIPEPGDIIFFDNFSNDGWSDHVGIVVSCDGTTVYTVEGNTHKDHCDTDSYSVNDSKIMGYGLPQY